MNITTHFLQINFFLNKIHNLISLTITTYKSKPDTIIYHQFTVIKFSLRQSK